MFLQGLLYRLVFKGLDSQKRERTPQQGFFKVSRWVFDCYFRRPFAIGVFLTKGAAILVRGSRGFVENFEGLPACSMPWSFFLLKA